MKCYLNAKSLALLIEVIRQNILNLKKVLCKAIQFPYTYLFYVLTLYSAYADDTTFFLRDERSAKKFINTFATFSKYSGLKPNHEKCKIAGIRVLKSVTVAVCSMKCIDLCNDTIKITGTHFSYNKKTVNEKKISRKHN